MTVEAAWALSWVPLLLVLYVAWGRISRCDECGKWWGSRQGIHIPHSYTFECWDRQAGVNHNTESTEGH